MGRMVVKLAFFKRFKNQNTKKRYENPAVNQAIDEINKRKEAENSGAAGDRKSAPAVSGDKLPEKRKGDFAPVLAFDPSGAGVENLVYKPTPVTPKASRSEQFDKEMENLAGIYGVDKAESESYAESPAPIIPSMAAASGVHSYPVTNVPFSVLLGFST